MLMILNRFISTDGTVTWLPRFDPVQTLDTEGYKSNLLPLTAGGVYDPQRGERLARRQRTLTYKGTLIEASEDAIQAAYDALSLASGTDGELYGTNELGTQTLHIHARMLVDPGQRTPKDMYRYRSWWAQDVSIVFELQEKAWRGTRHGTALAPLDTSSSLDVGVTLDDVADTTTLDTSSKTITVTNGGNMPCDQIVLDLLVGSADLTAFSYQLAKANCTWTGTVKAGNRLSIDTANALVKNQTSLTVPVVAGATALPVANAAGTGFAAGGIVEVVLDDGTDWWGTIASFTGTTTITLVTAIPGAAASGRTVSASAYSGFARVPILHRQAAWLELAPGTSSLLVTRTGGSTNSTLTLSYDDMWA